MNYLTYDYVFLSSNILLSYTYTNSEKFLVPGFITFTFMGKIHSTLPKCHEKIVCVVFSKLLGHLLQRRMAKNVASVLVHRHLNNTLSAALLMYFSLREQQIREWIEIIKNLQKESVFYVKDPSSVMPKLCCRPQFLPTARCFLDNSVCMSLLDNFNTTKLTFIIQLISLFQATKVKLPITAFHYHCLGPVMTYQLNFKYVLVLGAQRSLSSQTNTQRARKLITQVSSSIGLIKIKYLPQNQKVDSRFY